MLFYLMVKFYISKPLYHLTIVVLCIVDYNYFILDLCHNRCYIIYCSMDSFYITKQYVGKIGKIKYLIIVSIPLIYFLLQYFPLLIAQTGTLSFLLIEEGSIFLKFYNFIYKCFTNPACKST